MNDAYDSTQLIWSAPVWLIVLVFVLVATVFATSFLHVRSLPPGKTRWWTEILRIAGTLFLAITALQPEVHRTRTNSDRARVLVYVDETDSMQTRDVSLSSTNVVTRTEWVKSIEENPDVLRLQEEYNIAFRRFGHEQGQPKETDVSVPLEQALEEEGVAAVVLISDGDHNAQGKPRLAALRLQQQGVPVYGIAPGNETAIEDIELTKVDFPSYALAHEPMAVPFHLESHLNQEVRIQAVLVVNDTEVHRKAIRVAPHQQTSELLRWVSRKSGDVKVVVRLEPHPDEEFRNNNSAETRIEIREEKLRVLLVDTMPRWEFRFLRNAMMRDPGVIVECLLLHPGMEPAKGDTYITRFPTDPEEWSKYDVIFIGDIGVSDKELYPENAAAIVDLVKNQGSGLVFLPGMYGRQLHLTENLKDLMPVVLDERHPTGKHFGEEMNLWLTSSGRGHLLTQLDNNPIRNQNIWRNLPGFYWYASVLRSKVGSEELAVHATDRNENGRVPLLVTRDAGVGKVLFLGTDSAWRWRWGLEDVYHYRFWGQVVRWMAHRRHMFSQGAVLLFVDPERPAKGQTLDFNLTVLQTALLTDGASDLALRVSYADGQVEEPALKQVGESKSTFRARTSARAGGDAIIQVVDRNGSVLLEESLFISEDSRERKGKSVQLQLLKELARIGDGLAGTHEALGEVVDHILAKPRDRAVVETERVWQHPLWVAVLFGLFAAYWIIRKKQGWI